MLVVIALILFLTGAVGEELGLPLIALAVIAEILEVWLWMKYLKRHRVATGVEGMIGDRAIVVEPCRPEGTVRLRGEIWSARSADGVEAGQAVTVTGVDGLTLEVEPEKFRRAHVDRESL